MRGNSIVGIIVMLIGFIITWLTFTSYSLNAAPRVARAAKAQTKLTKKDHIYIEVVIEEVDLKASTISARGTVHIIPPQDNVGGQVFRAGTTDARSDQATKYVRLPVTLAADLKNKRPKVGQHVTLQLEMLRPGSLVVVGIEEFTAVERIGIESLDAPNVKPTK